MKLVSIISSQVITFGKVAGKKGGNVYGLNLTRLCEQRYGFLQSPKTLADYNLNTGVTFLHGYFQDRIVIDKFQVFESGFFVEAKGDTDDLEAFLDDVIKWAKETEGFTFEPDSTRPKIFQSMIEVQSKVSLAQSLKQVASLGKYITDTMKGYGNVTPDWELSGLSFGNGMAGDVASFKFERREGTPPFPNNYFAVARMRTKDHLRALEILEALL